jgi:hypothetical protein
MTGKYIHRFNIHPQLPDCDALCLALLGAPDGSREVEKAVYLASEQIFYWNLFQHCFNI